MSDRPSTFRVLRLLIALSVRRQLNRVSGLWGLRRGKRKGTPRKSRGGFFWVVLMGIWFVWIVITMSARTINNVAEPLRHPTFRGDGIPVSIILTGQLAAAELGLRGLDEGLDSLDPALRRLLIEARRVTVFAQLREDILDELRLQEVPIPERDATADRWLAVFREKGAGGFETTPSREYLYDPLPNPEHWPPSAQQPAMIGCVGTMLTILFVAILCQGLGDRGEGLGKVGWSMEWLFTMPASSSVIFLSRMLGYAASSFLAWVLVTPFLFVVFIDAGWSGTALPLAFLATGYFVLIVSAARLAAEVWLRRNFAASRLNNLQAVFSVVFTLFFFSLLVLGHLPSMPGWLTSVIRGMPAQAAWLPWSLPALWCAGGGTAWVAFGVMVLLACVVVCAAVGACGWMVRDGLVREGGSGVARSGAARPRRIWSAFRGMLGKELRLLARDRNFFVQSLVVPLMFVGMQLFLNMRALSQAKLGGRHLCTAAFGVGAYVLLFGAHRVLAGEKGALWLLYTFPVRIERAIREKVRLWSIAGCFYAAVVLAVGLGFAPSFGFSIVSDAALALAGVLLFAYIAAALGILGFEPLAEEERKKVNSDMGVIYMMLASFYGFGLYADSPWTKLQSLVLCALVGYALWQKVRDQIPYLLDPTQKPPPRVDLADGLIAALAFLGIQGVVTMLILLEYKPGEFLGGAMTIGYAVSGVVVVMISVLAFVMRKVRGWPAALGLGDKGASGARSALVGLVCGIVPAGLALLYLHAIEWIEPLRRLRDSMPMLSVDQLGYGWMIVLAVLMAPIFEEFIFRALVFRGLRRSFGFTISMLASAGIFAIVHPPISVIPVLVMGMAAALAFERTGRLRAPILAHAVYNASVIFLAQ